MNITDKLNSLKIGESCYYMGGIAVKCVEDKSPNKDCAFCHFKDKSCFPEINCAAVDREDGKDVVFPAVLIRKSEVLKTFSTEIDPFCTMFYDDIINF